LFSHRLLKKKGVGKNTNLTAFIKTTKQL